MKDNLGAFSETLDLNLFGREMALFPFREAMIYLELSGQWYVDQPGFYIGVAVRVTRPSLVPPSASFLLPLSADWWVHWIVECKTNLLSIFFMHTFGPSRVNCILHNCTWQVFFSFLSSCIKSSQFLHNFDDLWFCFCGEDFFVPSSSHGKSERVFCTNQLFRY